eukprot:CAMPEP_0172645168 /NCGR_PEP_ID=MMETSP1068-20121228/239588_1 /TAXON_ID=35684 /ORGANISM="Pseudopedinella elastica, Strain CCMP716" /LENGTH=43 /DNA_ID= /DNA_START= /DNA_END= /DNA_ORIENTATION=
MARPPQGISAVAAGDEQVSKPLNSCGLVKPEDGPVDAEKATFV